MIWCVLYITCVVVANYAFSVLPIWHGVPAATFVVGFVFVARDFAQRSTGHQVLWAMVTATVLSFALADPMVALASAVAFGVSEAVDWGVYTITKRPLADRILLSSAVGVPLDSIVFLGLLPFPQARPRDWLPFGRRNVPGVRSRHQCGSDRALAHRPFAPA